MARLMLLSIASTAIATPTASMASAAARLAFFAALAAAPAS
jgi:hypothetical protein